MVRSVDFQIDREMAYESVGVDTAAEIIRVGEIGASNSTVLELLGSESRRLELSELGLL